MVERLAFYIIFKFIEGMIGERQTKTHHSQTIHLISLTIFACFSQMDTFRISFGRTLL